MSPKTYQVINYNLNQHKNMKRLITVCTLLCLTFGYAQGQTSKRDSVLSRIDSLVQITNIWLEQIEIDNSMKNRYKMYPTENIYTLLKLDTKTGMIEQVQWSLDSDKEGTVTINNKDLSYGVGYGSNSFELYPTKNMYQFILLDKTDGRMWHVQWGMESTKRWMTRIY